MDTITESAMGIGMALEGGMGFIHCNSSIEVQARRVKNVKGHRNGFITSPVIFKPTNPLSDVDAI